MTSREVWTIERVWDALAARFDPARVAAIRTVTGSPDAAFDRAHDELRREVAELSGRGGDINRNDAKRQLVFGHLVLAVLDGIRRGRTAWHPVPSPRASWADDETALLLWAAEHGVSDIRESHVQERDPGTPV
ncbi:MAG: hypothetical protein ACRD2J_11930 [Thermoanaerobaculia bacterium]